MKLKAGKHLVRDAATSVGILHCHDIEQPSVDQALVRIVIRTVEDDLQLMNPGQRSADSIVASYQVGQIGIEEPACRDVSENIFVAKLRHQRSVVDETAADGIAS
jgi:hypothetical protein